MTELATPPTEQREGPDADQPLDRRQSVPGTSGRSGPVYNPAPGSRRARSTSPPSRRSTPPSRLRRTPSRPGARSRSSRRAELFFRIRELVHDRREEVARILTAEHGKVLSDAMGEVTRGLEVIEFCLRDPAPAQGRHDRAGLDRHRRLLDPPAARRRRRDHAVQLPGDGAHVDVGARARLRQHVRAQAVREGSVRLDLDGRAAQGGRRPRRRLQRRARRQGRGRRASSSTRTSPRSASSARRRSRATSTRPARSTASASRRSAGRRTT